YLRGIGPGDEVEVVGQAALKGDRVIFRPPHPFQDDGVAAFLVLDHVGGSLQAANLAHSRNRCRRGAAIDQKTVGFVRIVAVYVNGERLAHGTSPQAVAVWPASCAIWMI